MRLSRFTHPLWNQLQQFQTDMNRLFDRWDDHQIAPTFPPVNVWEDGEQLHIEAELPGLELKDLEIYVTAGNQLTIKGQRRPVEVDKSVWHRKERGFGNFVRVLTLPYPVDAEKVSARLEQGVLTLLLTKHESARPRKIPVKAE